jgi:hypothetical protein
MFRGSMKKTRVSIRASIPPVLPVAPVADTLAGDDPIGQSAAIVDAFAVGKDSLTIALLARVASAIRSQSRGMR